MVVHFKIIEFIFIVLVIVVPLFFLPGSIVAVIIDMTNIVTAISCW